jgi:5-methyltetrahydropteroyltriglutamate--homocysteine methyltransferase
VVETRRFRTAVVGSYPQPEWLVHRDRLRSRLPPRVRARELWRVEDDALEQAQDDAVRLAVADMERAGIDVVSDGEMRRESYSNYFVSHLDGVDVENPGTAIDRTGKPNPVPAIRGPVRRTAPVEVDAVRFLRALTDRTIKITLPGPFTMTQQAENVFYDSDEELAFAFADAVNAEIRDLLAAGADVVQIDEPYLEARHEQARRYGVAAVDRAVEGVGGTTALHICFGYGHIVKDKPPGYHFLEQLDGSHVDQISLEAQQPGLDLSVLERLPSKTIMLGLLDLSTTEVEPVPRVVARAREALRHVDPERLVLAPDCGMKYLPREVAFAKLEVLAAAADELSRSA